VIVIPKSKLEWTAMAAFINFHAKVSPSPDMQFFGYVRGEKLCMVVALDGFLGKTAQINVANAPDWHFTPRVMLREVFRYAFVTAGREMLLGVLNSRNTRAMNYDLHLGFRELLRLPGLHEDGGDFVVLGLKKSDCRYIDAMEVPSGQEIRSAARA